MYTDHRWQEINQYLGGIPTLFTVDWVRIEHNLFDGGDDDWP